jgi:hypothetical protein
MNNYDVSNYMRKYYAEELGGNPGEAAFPDVPVADDIPEPSNGKDGAGADAKHRKPRTRLSKWLAKIAGVYDGEMEPKTEAEYYLNEIAQKDSGSGGGVFFVTDNNSILDKTWAEISAASENGVVVLNLNNRYPRFGYLMDVGHVEEAFGCIFMVAGKDLRGNLVTAFLSYSTSAENGYPERE